MTALKYNIDLEPCDVQRFVSNPLEKEKEKEKKDDWLTVVRSLDAIPIERTIEMFQNINTMFIIFFEKLATQSKASTKRINFNFGKNKRTLRMH